MAAEKTDSREDNTKEEEEYKKKNVIGNEKSFLGWGVRLSPLGTSATNWSIVQAPDDR
jgi:hypothetical protein